MSQIGTAGKLDAHQRGLKHRAISVLVRNSAGEFLLQRRKPGEISLRRIVDQRLLQPSAARRKPADAARRRLAQEMGFSCPIEPLFVFHYNAPVPGGLIENEVVHVFGGRHDGAIKPDPAEVSEWKWMRYADPWRRHARAARRLHRLVPAICRPPRRDTVSVDRPKLDHDRSKL